MNGLASIVIVTCNRLTFTEMTLESLFTNAGYPNYEVIILDNGSTDGTVQYLNSLESHPNVKEIIYLPNNIGKPRAANTGFAQAKGDYIIGIDDDVIFPKNWLSKLVEALDTIPNLGWLCINFTNLPQDWFKPEYERHFGNIVIQETPQVGGQVVAMPRSTYEAIGGYYDGYYYGIDDGDYNLRARKRGLLTGYLVDVVGYHLGGTELETRMYPEYYQYKLQVFQTLVKGDYSLAAQDFFASPDKEKKSSSQ